MVLLNNNFILPHYALSISHELFFFAQNHFLLPTFISSSWLSLLHTEYTLFLGTLLQGYWYFEVTLRHLSHMPGCWTDKQGRTLCHECHVHMYCAPSLCRKSFSAKPLSWASFAVLEEAKDRSSQWWRAGERFWAWELLSSLKGQLSDPALQYHCMSFQTQLCRLRGDQLAAPQLNMFNYFFSLATLSERGFILNLKPSVCHTDCQVKNDRWDSYQIVLTINVSN